MIILVMRFGENRYSKFALTLQTDKKKLFSYSTELILQHNLCCVLRY